jgi:hypothetical protein
MERLRLELDAVVDVNHKGSLMGRCPICPGSETGNRHLSILPPGDKGRPYIRCYHAEHSLPEMRAALLKLGIDIRIASPSALPGATEEDKAARPSRRPPSEKALHRYADRLFEDDFFEFLDYLREKVGLSDSQIREEELGVGTWRNLPHITVPVRDIAGELAGVHLWNPFATGSQPKKSWIPGHKGAQHLLGAHKLARWRANWRIVLTEGASDYLANTALGIPCVAVMAGAGAIPSELDALAGREVVVGYDADPTGQQGARKVVGELLGAGAEEVWLADLRPVLSDDDHKDWRDWIVEESATAEDVLAFLQETVAGPTFNEIADAAIDEVDWEQKVRQKADDKLLDRAGKRLADADEAMEDWDEPPFVPDMKEELELVIPEIEWTVEGLHPSGGNTSPVGTYKAGKTVLELNLAKSLADGKPFLGHATHLADGGRVGWWNYELTTGQARRWMSQLDIEHPERITHLPLRGYPMPLGSDVIVDWAVEWLRSLNIKVWIIDPFAEAYDGEENSATEVKLFTRKIDEIKRRAGVPDVFLTLHTGHAEHEEGRERPKGSSKLPAWYDVGWYYTVHPDNDDLRFFRAHGRDVSVPNFAVRMDPLTRELSCDEVTKGMTRDVAAASSKAHWVAEIVARHEGINQGTLRDELGGGRHEKKDKWIALAEKLGLIRIERGPNNSLLHYPIPQENFKLHGEEDE